MAHGVSPLFPGWSSRFTGKVRAGPRGAKTSVPDRATQHDQGRQSVSQIPHTVSHRGPSRHGLHTVEHTSGSRHTSIAPGALTAPGPGRSATTSKSELPEDGMQKVSASVLENSVGPPSSG